MHSLLAEHEVSWVGSGQFQQEKGGMGRTTKEIKEKSEKERLVKEDRATKKGITGEKRNGWRSMAWRPER